MEDTTISRPFNKRAFVALAMTISVLILPVSGIMIHELQFESLTPTKHFWMSVHNMDAFLFIIFAVTHISLNRRALKNYIAQKGRSMLSKESLAAAVLVAGIVFLFALHAFHLG
jgi:hypothetical protein